LSSLLGKEEEGLIPRRPGASLPLVVVFDGVVAVAVAVAGGAAGFENMLIQSGSSGRLPFIAGALPEG
jgi:hypothetical protein